MPIFVGTGDTSSRIRSNRVGFASHSANPGTASEGDVYFNSSDSGLRAYDGSAWSAVGAGGGTVEAVASGSLSNGSTVVLNDGGTVSAISSSTLSQIAGSAFIFDYDSVGSVSTCYDASIDRIVIAYYDSGNSNYGKVICADVNPDTNQLTFGSAYTFNSASTTYLTVVYDPVAERVVVIFRDGGNSNYGTARVLKMQASGSAVDQAGSKVVFASEASRFFDASFDSNRNSVFFVWNGGSNYAKAIAGTVTGGGTNSISFGSASTFSANNSSYYPNVAYDANADRHLIVWQGHSGVGNSGRAIVATLSSSNGITYGSVSEFESNEIYEPIVRYDSVSQKSVIVFYDTDGNSYGGADTLCRGIVATITASNNSVSFGAVNTFEYAYGGYFALTHDTVAKKFTVFYYDYQNSSYGTYVVGEIVGTGLTFSNPATFNSSNTNHIASSYDSKNKRVVWAYQTNNDGKANVFQHAFVDTNLTSTNFLGFSDAAYSNGATAKVQIVGSIDDAQTGLTTGSIHYVQKNGSLGIAASTPSVVAGIALTDTKILIRK